MQVTAHVIASLSVSAAVWFWTRSIYAGALCLISGVCIDIDHILEYIIYYGRKNFSLMNVYRACDASRRREKGCKFKKVFLIFHSLEAVILFWALVLYTKNIYILAIAAGYSTHLFMDSLGNFLAAHCYFIFWRAVNGFKIDKLSLKTLPLGKDAVCLPDAAQQ